MAYKIFLSTTTWQQLQAYKQNIENGTKIPGRLLLQKLQEEKKLKDDKSEGEKTDKALTDLEFLNILLNTKQYCVYSEQILDFSSSECSWNSDEIALLANIFFSMDVEIYDNGCRSGNIQAYSKSDIFNGTLLFVPGPLLTNVAANPDYQTAITKDETINILGYNALIAQRLLPTLLFINNDAAKKNIKAFIQIPGLGCGNFAGDFRKEISRRFADALTNILQRHALQLPNIAAIRLDLFDKTEIVPQQRLYHLTFILAASAQDKKPQFTKPQDFGEQYTKCAFYKVVAADHGSYPFNDFNDGSDKTDEGRAGASTNGETVLTGVPGFYDPQSHHYKCLQTTSGSWQQFYADPVTKRTFKLQACESNTILFDLFDLSTKQIEPMAAVSVPTHPAAPGFFSTTSTMPPPSETDITTKKIIDYLLSLANDFAYEELLRDIIEYTGQSTTITFAHNNSVLPDKTFWIGILSGNKSLIFSITDGKTISTRTLQITVDLEHNTLGWNSKYGCRLKNDDLNAANTFIENFQRACAEEIAQRCTTTKSTP